MHAARSLTRKGSKQVERVVQSESATTHYFTVMPILFAGGHMRKRLYVVLRTTFRGIILVRRVQSNNLSRMGY
ncbi:hypothetical protein ANCDUO_04455 [Ancylostoma duodenale]|uniref:Uncharacterized protein n=1 Tax=Ancylostoma duodenale TaxID=51022 RepID=A0A0C2GUY8_9BILA|nr:hypothetical protein ANCDUO_04455 [Ancylostoma duodenale]